MITGSASRSGLIRTAALYTPLFLIALGATVAGFVTRFLGTFDPGVILLFIGIVLSFLFGYQSIQALRDLRENRTVTTQGPVTRIWSKMDLFVSRSHYVAVGRNIFRVPVQAYWDLREEAKRMKADGSEDDYLIEVRIEHYPHTGNVVGIERLGVVPRVQREPQRGSA
jgi:hypothetical protein